MCVVNVAEDELVYMRTEDRNARKRILLEEWWEQRIRTLESENDTLKAKLGYVTKQTNAAHAVTPFAVLAKIRTFTGGYLQNLSDEALKHLPEEITAEKFRRLFLTRQYIIQSRRLIIVTRTNCFSHP